MRFRRRNPPSTSHRSRCGGWRRGHGRSRRRVDGVDPGDLLDPIRDVIDGLVDLEAAGASDVVDACDEPCGGSVVADVDGDGSEVVPVPTGEVSVERRVGRFDGQGGDGEAGPRSLVGFSLQAVGGPPKGKGGDKEEGGESGLEIAKDHELPGDAHGCKAAEDVGDPVAERLGSAVDQVPRAGEPAHAGDRSRMAVPAEAS